LEGVCISSQEFLAPKLIALVGSDVILHLMKERERIEMVGTAGAIQ